MKSTTVLPRCRCRREWNSAMTGLPSTSSDSILIPSGRRVSGRLRVPPSKSLTHRWLNLALLSRRPMVVERPLLAEDTRLFLAALERCGFRVEEGEGEVRLEPGDPTAGEVELFCGNAGTKIGRAHV